MSPTVCPRCAHENPAESNFCASCGTTLSRVVDEPTEMLEMPVGPDGLAAPPKTVGFMVSRGPKAGSRYQLDVGSTTLGRHPESTIFFDDVTVSRRHAEVVFDGRVVSVADVGSLNGTYVNQVAVEKAVELKEGDVLQIGKFKLVFFHGDGA